MAEAQPFDLDLSAPEANALPIYRRLGLLNGLLIGLALGLGAWGLEALHVARLPSPLYLPTLLLGLVIVIALGGLVGWLTARIANNVVSVILWLAMAVAMMLIMGYLPYYGRSFVVWLADTRFWGRTIFPYTLGGGQSGLILGGLLIMLALGVLGLLQGYRLERLVSDSDQGRRLGRRIWLSLLLPVPLVFLASLITQSMLSNPAATAVEQTYQAIEIARNYQGDLIALKDSGGPNVTALRGVRDRLEADYTLSIVDVNPLNSTVVVGANFPGAWLYCRVINDQLSHCYDAEPSYTIGLRSLVTGEPLPEDCRGCALQATDAAAAWLAEHRGQFGANPALARIGQWGNHVLMQVQGDAGQTAECWIEGVTPTTLTSCTEP